MAGAVAAFAVASALGRVFGIEAEMEQRVAMDGGHHDDVAAAAAVAAAGTAARNVFLAPERQTAVAAVARFHGDSYFIYKHENKRPLTRGESAVDSFGNSENSYATLLMLTYLPMRPRSLNSTTPVIFGEERVILAPAHVFAGLDRGAALAHDDRAAGNELPAEDLHAEPLRVRIAPVFGTA